MQVVELLLVLFYMVWAMGALLTVAALLTAITVLLLTWGDKRRQRRVESWRCPACQALFEDEAIVGEWVSQDGAATGGPVLRCQACASEFRFSWRGEWAAETDAGVINQGEVR